MSTVKPQYIFKDIRVIENAHQASVLSLKILANDMLISSSRDKSIRFWHIDHCIHDLQDAHKDAVRCLQPLPNNLIASGSADCSIKIWNLQKGL